MYGGEIMNTTREFAKNALSASYNDFSEEYIHRIKMRIIDSFGVSIAGWNGPFTQEVCDIFLGYGGAPEATLLTRGDKIPGPAAAFLNSLMLRAFDFEAVQAEMPDKKSGPAHITGSTFPAAVVCADRADASGKDFITALALGDDICARLAGAQGFSVYDYFDNTGTLNGVGAALIAAKLAGLSEDNIVNALGLAVNSVGGTMQNVFEAKMSFKFPMANAARAGVLASDLAAKGFQCIEDPLTGERGFFDLFCGEPKTERLLEDLGKIYYADVVIKPWSACRATHKTIQSTLTATGGRTFEPEEIEKIEIFCTPYTRNFVGGEFPFGNSTQVQGAFNIRYTCCTAILRGSVRPKYFTDDKRNDPKIGELLSKLVVTERENNPETEVKITLANGEVLTAKMGTEDAFGDVVHAPMSDEQIIEKFHDNVRFADTISEEREKVLLDTLMNLEKADKFRDVIELTLA